MIEGPLYTLGIQDAGTDGQNVVLKFGYFDKGVRYFVPVDAKSALSMEFVEAKRAELQKLANDVDAFNMTCTPSVSLVH